MTDKSRTNHAPSSGLSKRRWDRIFKDQPVPEGGPVVIKGDVTLDINDEDGSIGEDKE